jgi:plastocyanin
MSKATGLGFAAITFIVGAVVLPSCGPVSPPEPEEGVADVSIADFAFEPRNVTIRAGERVRWTNLESFPIPHTATSGGPDDEDGLFDTGTLLPGDSFTQVFEDPGEFIYYCRFHPTVELMVGAMVIVEAEAP